MSVIAPKIRPELAAELLRDEPTGALDAQTGRLVLEVLDRVIPRDECIHPTG